MNLLTISYGTRFAGACLMEDERVVGCATKDDFVVQFPKDMINDVLSKGRTTIEQIDYVVFLGKPFSYFMRLIDLHAKLFPFSFLRFASDFKYFFVHQVGIRSKVKEDLDFQKNMCFVEVSDVIASQIAREHSSEQVSIVVILQDTLSSRIGGCYEKDDNSTYLLRELAYTDFYDVLRESASAESHCNGLKRKLADALKCTRKTGQSKTVLASDFSFHPDLTEELKKEGGDLSFRTLSFDQMLEYSGKYAFNMIREM